MKTIALLLLTIASLTAGLIRVPTSDPRITSISYNEYAGMGAGSFQGPICPQGRVWYIQTAGIGTTTSKITNYLEWMMQVATCNPQGVAGVWLFPLEVNVGWKGGTPVLAITRPVILKAGQCLYPRVDAMPNDKQMILLFDGWEIWDSCLPELLGLGNVASANPGLDSINREIQASEQSLQTLKGK